MSKILKNLSAIALLLAALSALSSCKKDAEPDPAEPTQDEIEARWPATISTAEVGDFVLVKRDTFEMGSNDAECVNATPVHTVSFSASYYMCTTEVTQKQWTDIMGSNPSDTYDPEGIGDDKPVNNITVAQINEFIEKLEAATGRDFELPTEAQWEWAAMGGVNSKGYVYAGSNNWEDVAEAYGNPDGRVYSVKQKAPNELGLYDMSGNVEEFCRDRYRAYTEGHQTDPAYTGSTSYNTRGGSSGQDLKYMRIKSREKYGITHKFWSNGFRLLMVAPLDSELLPE